MSSSYTIKDQAFELGKIHEDYQEPELITGIIEETLYRTSQGLKPWLNNQKNIDSCQLIIEPTLTQFHDYGLVEALEDSFDFDGSTKLNILLSMDEPTYQHDYEALRNIQESASGPTIELGLTRLESSNISLLKLAENAVDQISISEQSLRDSPNKSQYFKYLAEFAADSNVRTHLRGVSSTSNILLAHDWDYDLISGQAISDTGDSPPELKSEIAELIPSLKAVDDESESDSDRTDLDNLRVDDKPFTLLVTGQSPLIRWYSLPLAYHRIPHRLCESFADAMEEMDQYDFDLFIISLEEFNKHKSSLDQSKIDRLRRTPRIVILDESDPELSTITSRDAPWEIIDDRPGYAEYFDKFEQLNVAREIDNKKSSKTLRKREIVGILLIVALMIGIALGPALETVRRAARSTFETSSYVIESVEEIKGYLDRDEQRELRRQRE